MDAFTGTPNKGNTITVRFSEDRKTIIITWLESDKMMTFKNCFVRKSWTPSPKLPKFPGGLEIARKECTGKSLIHCDPLGDTNADHVNGTSRWCQCEWESLYERLQKSWSQPVA